jgi:outer membrane translocation and assembly module TamA
VGALDGALFYDVGNVGPSSFELGRKFGHALGFGLRYRLPVGPLRLDFGYNPGERFAAQDSWALHLSFGFSF